MGDAQAGRASPGECTAPVGPAEDPGLNGAGITYCRVTIIPLSFSPTIVMRPTPVVAIAILALLASSGPVQGQAIGTVLLPKGPLTPCYPAHGTHRVLVHGERLQAAYDLLLARSPTFAAAVAAVETGGSMRVRIGYREQLFEAHERLLGEEGGGAALLADGDGFHPPGTILCEVRVVFFTEGLEEELVATGVSEEDVILDLAVVLVHEVFGHLIPFADQPVPVWPTPCRDPRHRWATLATGCAVDRENVIRRELGLPERVVYAHVDGPLLCALHGQTCAEGATVRRTRADPLGTELLLGIPAPAP